jgi:hypothetical protein
VEGIKDVFIPDTAYIDSAYSGFVEDLKEKFSLDTTAFETLFDNEKPVEDVTADYYIPGVGNFKLKMLDVSFFKDGVNAFRPIIRGFLVLLMLLYHVKQVIGFFGYNAGVVQGRSEWIAYNKSNTGGHKE